MITTTQTERILASARDLYLNDGLKGVSMRKIAAQVGVTAPAIYRHFENKEAIVAEMLEEGYRIFGNYLYRALSADTPEKRLHASGLGFVGFALEQPQYYETIFMSPSDVWTEDLPESHEEGGVATFQFLVDRVRECMESGYLRKDDAEEVAMTIWAQSHGLASLYLTKRIDCTEDEFREKFMRGGLRIIEGLR